MNAIVHLAEAVLWVFRFCLALLSTCCALLSCCAVWRIPFVLREYAKAEPGLNGLTVTGMCCLGMSAADIITLCACCLVLPTWRMPSLLRDLSRTLSKRSRTDSTFDLHANVWENLAYFLCDIPLIALLALDTLMVWHAPYTWRAVYRELSTRGFSHEHLYEIALRHMAMGVLDFLLLPFGAVVVGTWYRLAVVEEERRSRAASLNNSSGSHGRYGSNVSAARRDMYEKMHEKQTWVCQGLAVLGDLCVFGVVALFTFPLVLRTSAVARDVRKAVKANTSRAGLISDVRAAALENMALSFRELVGVVAYLVLLPTVYRFVKALSAARALCEAKADPRPHTQLTSVVPEFPEKGGLKLHVKGLKTPDLAFTDAQLLVLDEPFWERLAGVLGTPVCYIAQGFLPLDLTPFHGVTQPGGKRDALLAADFKEGETEFETTMYFQYSKEKDIVKNLTSLGLDSDISLTIEFGKGHEGTLMHLKANFRDLIDCAKSGGSLLNSVEMSSGYIVTPTGNYINCISNETTADLLKNADRTEGELFCDVMTAPAIIQLGLLLTDILGAVLFVALHLFPWRAYGMYRAIRSTEATEKKRKALRVAHSLNRALSGEHSSPDELCSRMEAVIANHAKGGSGAMQVPAGTVVSLPRDVLRDNGLPVGSRWVCMHEELPTAYLDAKESDYDTFNRTYNAIASFRGGFESADEDALAKDVTLLLSDMTQRLAAYTAFAVESRRHSLSLVGETPHPPEEKWPSRRHRPAKNSLSTKPLMCTMEDIFPWVHRLAKHYVPSEEQNAAAEPESDGEGGDAPLPALPSGQGFFRDYKLLVKGVASQPCRINVLPEPTEQLLADAWEYYRGESAALAPQMEATAERLTTAAEARLAVEIAELGRESRAWDLTWAKRVVFSELAELAQDAAAGACAVCVAATLYRLPSLLRSIRRDAAFEGWRRCVFSSFAELLADAGCALKALWVFACVRNAGPLVMSVVEEACRTGSAERVRDVVDYYAALAVADLVSIITLVCTFRTLRWGVGCVAVGFLTPGVLLERAFFRRNQKAWVAALLIVVACAWLYGLPSFLLAGRFARSGMAFPLGFFLASVIAVMAASLGTESLRAWRGRGMPARRRASMETTKAAPLGHSLEAHELVHSRFVRLNWCNATQFAYTALESLWLVALAGQATASAAAAGVRELSHNALLGDAGLWVAAAGTAAYYMLVALPVVVLAIQSNVVICKHYAWVYLMAFLAYPAQVFIVGNLLPFVLRCEGEQCSEADHQTWALRALLMLVFYLFTSVVRVPEYSTARAAVLDIVTLDLYESFIRFALAVGTVVAVFARPSPTAACLAVALCGVWCAGWTQMFPSVFRVERCVSADCFQLWRVYCYAAASCAALCILAVEWCDSATAGGTAFACCLLCLTAWLVLRLRKLGGEDVYELEVTPAQVQEELLAVHDKLVSRQEVWLEDAVPWRSFVEGNVRSSQLSLALMRLEHHTALQGCDPVFLTMRAAWYQDLWGLVDSEDVRADFKDRMAFRRNIDPIGSMLCECFCPCDRDLYRLQHHDPGRQVNTAADMPKLLELLRKFSNSIMQRDDVTVSAGIAGITPSNTLRQRNREE